MRLLVVVGGGKSHRVERAGCSIIHGDGKLLERGPCPKFSATGSVSSWVSLSVARDEFLLRSQTDQRFAPKLWAVDQRFP